tara:strand:+ start:778 stop:888 length:111 start_codon:yes stop_codon:yes gene_type:complete
MNYIYQTTKDIERQIKVRKEFQAQKQKEAKENEEEI